MWLVGCGSNGSYFRLDLWPEKFEPLKKPYYSAQKKYFPMTKVIKCTSLYHRRTNFTKNCKHCMSSSKMWRIKTVHRRSRFECDTTRYREGESSNRFGDR